MIDIAELTNIFKEKLEKSGSFDEAILKLAWIAYQKGLEDGRRWEDEL